MKYCSKCKKNFKDEINFCNQCGKKLSDKKLNVEEPQKAYPHFSKKLNEEKNKSSSKTNIIKNIFLCVLILIIIILACFMFPLSSQNVNLRSKINVIESDKSNLQREINGLNNRISEKNTEINEKNAEISEKSAEIQRQNQEIIELNSRVNELEDELGITKTQLEETTVKYEEAKPYQERVERGQTLTSFYPLLADYEEYAQPIILKYLGLSQPITPKNDAELWLRGKNVYEWISNNFKYCGDKGLRVGSTFAEFQFYTADELLMSDNVRCGDCDDFATLFASLMYASGVQTNKVWEACGTVDGGGHCWNWLSISGQSYRIDPVCSQRQTVISVLGFDIGFKSANYPSDSYQNVQCLSNYKENLVMNPQGIKYLK